MLTYLLRLRVRSCNHQDGVHSPLEDAQAAMLLYLKFKKDFEREAKLRAEGKVAHYAAAERHKRAAQDAVTHFNYRRRNLSRR